MHTVKRRFILAGIAIAASAITLHAQLSSALVVRADDVTAAGQLSHARAILRRAIALDPENGTAVDRFAFDALLSHQPRLERDGVAVASAYLRRHPDDAVVRFDRALTLQALRRFGEAETDFALVGRAKRDARALTFAGFAAWHAGARAKACGYWRDATHVDRTFFPARHARGRCG